MQYQKPVIIQEQRLKMNPQLYQAIQLMALPIQDLRLRIQEELEKNPALEIVNEKGELSWDEAQSETQTQTEYDAFENTSDPGYRQPLNTEATDQKHKFIEGALSRGESLHDHLMWQLRLQPISDTAMDIGELLINNLDSNGFHREPVEKLIKEEMYPLADQMKQIIQNFDPIGVCTSDHIEALLVQVKNDPDAPNRIDEIINHHMKLLERGKYLDIARKMKISEDRVKQLLAYLKTLDPFPGRKYLVEETQYVIPDLMIKEREGELVIILNEEEIPVLGVNDFFNNIISGEVENSNKEAKKFVNSTVRDAQWFIRSVNQRNSTLVKIAKAIVEFQRDFFFRGPKALVPLTLKDVADTVSVHETTVSRISNKKYVQTEWGIFELKYFFTNSISGAGSSGSRFSKEGVKQVIKEIIEEYSGEKKLSDQKISDILETKGINIARRTVAKYRKELDISSSFQR